MMNIFERPAMDPAVKTMAALAFDLLKKPHY